MKNLDDLYAQMRLSRIATLREARKRWGKLSEHDKKLLRQLAESWSLSDLVPKEPMKTTKIIAHGREFTAVVESAGAWYGLQRPDALGTH